MRGENEEVNNEKEIGRGWGAREEGNTNVGKDRDKDEGGNEREGGR